MEQQICNLTAKERERECSVSRNHQNEMFKRCFAEVNTSETEI